jgi:hypothetical protein
LRSTSQGCPPASRRSAVLAVGDNDAGTGKPPPLRRWFRRPRARSSCAAASSVNHLQPRASFDPVDIPSASPSRKPAYRLACASVPAREANRAVYAALSVPVASASHSRNAAAPASRGRSPAPPVLSVVTAPPDPSPHCAGRDRSNRHRCGVDDSMRRRRFFAECDKTSCTTSIGSRRHEGIRDSARTPPCLPIAATLPPPANRIDPTRISGARQPRRQRSSTAPRGSLVSSRKSPPSSVVWSDRIHPATSPTPIDPFFLPHVRGRITGSGIGQAAPSQSERRHLSRRAEKRQRLQRPPPLVPAPRLARTCDRRGHRFLHMPRCGRERDVGIGTTCSPGLDVNLRWRPRPGLHDRRLPGTEIHPQPLGAFLHTAGICASPHLRSHAGLLPPAPFRRSLHPRPFVQRSTTPTSYPCTSPRVGLSTPVPARHHASLSRHYDGNHCRQTGPLAARAYRRITQALQPATLLGSHDHLHPSLSQPAASEETSAHRLPSGGRCGVHLPRGALDGSGPALGVVTT